jgi:hypothetical protein
VDTIRILPAGDPFTVEKPLAKCAGCCETFPLRDLITLHEGHHDGLVFFDGNEICRPCARRSGVEV